jgi:hypothetical protein
MHDPEPPASVPLTLEQAIRLGSRLTAAYLILWAISDAFYLPRAVLSLARSLQNSPSYSSLLNPASLSYAVRYEILTLSEYILRIALFLFLAISFYRVVPRVHRFFTAE